MCWATFSPSFDRVANFLATVEALKGNPSDTVRGCDLHDWTTRFGNSRRTASVDGSRADPNMGVREMAWLRYGLRSRQPP